MSQTVIKLGFLPKDRGDYNNEEKYYKDNIIQYRGSSYIADPVGYNPSTPEISYNQGVPPYITNPHNLNPGWRIFASGNNKFATGENVEELNIDNEPTVNSNSLVKSSGVHNELALGAVYDVSAKNPTAGPNNDGKFTLDYILDPNNVNTLIPSAFRKGGMSIKFVQTSDNKYVQFRCKASTFTTDTNEWIFEGDDVLVDNPEWAYIVITKTKQILGGFKHDGSFEYSKGVPTPIKKYIEGLHLENKVDKESGKGLIIIDFANMISSVDNPEYIDYVTDSEHKLLEYTEKDGTKGFTGNVKIGKSLNAKELLLNGVKISPTSTIDVNYIIDDVEERMEMGIDAEKKIITERKPDGTLVENVGIETPHLELKGDGLDDLGRALKAGGYGNVMDWSDKEFVEIPIPRTCAVLNFGVNSQATSKSDRPDYNPGVNADIPTFIEFWDKDGNYFKKPILLSAQGSSSMSYWIKNQAFDLDDGSTIKFGNWVSQDSFHVKKYYIDVFRGQCIVGYWLTEQMYQTRAYGERRPWDYLNQGGDTVGAIGKFKKDYETGALAHPDGFPVHVFFNGNDAGIYTFNLKKHRDNYYADKKSAKNIILDGQIGSAELFMGNVDWTAFEIRNPKSLKLVDGSSYDGDNPQEITGDASVDATSAKVKGYIERLSGAFAAINANKTKAEFEKYFNVPFFIDYFLVSQVLWHQDGFWKNWIWCTWDGQKWAPTSYDMDSIFGANFDGTFVVPAGEYQLPKTNVTAWTNTNTLIGSNVHVVSQLWDLYATEIRARYKELRDAGIFTTGNIVGLMEKWVNKVGYDNLKNDIENICANNDVPQTPSYRNGNETYALYPTTGGFYNSILRVKRWLDEHFVYLDSADIMNYN